MCVTCEQLLLTAHIALASAFLSCCETNMSVCMCVCVCSLEGFSNETLRNDDSDSTGTGSSQENDTLIIRSTAARMVHALTGAPCTLALTRVLYAAGLGHAARPSG